MHARAAMLRAWTRTRPQSRRSAGPERARGHASAKDNVATSHQSQWGSKANATGHELLNTQGQTAPTLNVVALATHIAHQAAQTLSAGYDVSGKRHTKKPESFIMIWANSRTKGRDHRPKQTTLRRDVTGRVASLWYWHATMTIAWQVVLRGVRTQGRMADPKGSAPETLRATITDSCLFDRLPLICTARRCRRGGATSQAALHPRFRHNRRFTPALLYRSCRQKSATRALPHSSATAPPLQATARCAGQSPPVRAANAPVTAQHIVHAHTEERAMRMPNDKSGQCADCTAGVVAIAKAKPARDGSSSRQPQASYSGGIASDLAVSRRDRSTLAQRC